MRARIHVAVLAVLALIVGAAGAQAQTETISLERAASEYDALVEQSNARYEAGDIDGAATLLERAVALDRARPEAFNNLGVAELDRGDYAQAARRFAELALLVGALPERDSSAAQYYLKAHDGMLEAGGLLLDEGGLAEARDIFTTLVQMYPESGDGRHNLALALAELAAFEESEGVARAMIEREPLSDAGWAFRMDAYAGMSELAEDDAEYDDFLQRYDDVHAQAEALPIRLDQLLVDGSAGTLTGHVVGGSAAAGENVRLRMRFIGRDGVMDEREVTFTSPGIGQRVTFSAPGPRAPITGLTYTLVE